MFDLFNNSGLLQANYKATLKGWSKLNTIPSNLELGATNLTYCYEIGRNALIAKGWTITGDSKECS